MAKRLVLFCQTGSQIQFTFEVVPCLILGLSKNNFKGLFSDDFPRCESILAQHYKGV